MAQLDRLPEEDRPDIGQDVPKAKLRAIEGGGETSDPERGHLAAAPDEPGEDSLYNEHGDEEEQARLSAVAGGGETTARRRGHVREAGKAKELEDERLGAGYVERAPNRLARIRRKFTRRRVAFAAGFGIFGFGGVGVLFLMLIPLKVENLVQNVENRYFSTSESAVSDETDNLFKGWIKTSLAPALQKGDCARSGRVIISKDCTVNVAGNGKNPVVNLYKTWAQAKLENRLSAEHGIELRYDPGGKGTFYLKAPGIEGGQTKVGNGVAGIDDKAFSAADRGTVRQTFRKAESDMTLWKKVMFRYKVGRLLEEKYGIKRCIIFCGTRDSITDWKNNKKYAAKAFLVDRVIGPRSAAMGAVIGCLLDQNQCQQKESSTTCTESSCDELNGEPQTKATADVEKAVGEASSKFGSETADEVIKHISNIREAGGIQNYVLEAIFTKLFGEDTAGKAVPVIGWLQMLSAISHFIASAGKAVIIIKAFSYVVNSQAAVSTYMMYRTYADEIHTGNVDATEVGSFNDSLGPGSQCAKPLEGSCGSQLGGNAGAENTPLYNYVIGGNKPMLPGNNVSSFLTDAVSTKVYADSNSPGSDNTPDYTCANGGPVPASTSPVCPEEIPAQTNGVAKSLSHSLNSSGLTGLAASFNGIPGLSTVLNIGNDIVGWLASGAAGAVEGAVKLLPGGAAVINDATKEVGKFFTFLAGVIIPPFESSDQSGGRTGDAVIIGGDVAGNDYAHSGLGGRSLKPKEVADIVNQQQEERKQQFDGQSFFARMFDTDSTDSLISKVAMEIPFGFQNEIQSGFANLLNPLGSISHGFAAIFAGHANAVAPPIPDPAHITQYGLTAADMAPVNTGAKATAYWDKHCSDNASYAYRKTNDWNDAASRTTDPNTGMPMNKKVNLCALLKGTGGNAGGALDSSNLTQDDLADEGGSGGSAGGTTSPTGTLPDGTSKELATQLLPYIQSGKITCALSQASNCNDIQNTSKGVSIKGNGCLVDSLQPGLLGLLLGLVKEGHTFILTALCNGHHTDDITEHAGGRAADFNTIDGVFIGPSDSSPWSSDKVNAARKLDQDATALVPDKSRLQFGQVGAGSGFPACHAVFSFQNGYNNFPDGCSHQHIQVEPGN